ncbi:hypothetical protein CGRA01v4_03062 [Colletotrichum graminicola]|nr:hypothetical protein CGRA01v4_03062 [Colletotrichum graminicola]
MRVGDARRWVVARRLGFWICGWRSLGAVGDSRPVGVWLSHPTLLRGRGSGVVAEMRNNWMGPTKLLELTGNRSNRC